MFRQLTERSSTFAMKRLRIFVRTRARSSGVEQNRRWGRAFEKALASSARNCHIETGLR